MNLYLGQYISEDELKVMGLISRLSDSLDLFFKDKSYGESINEINIGIVCVKPEFDSFFSPDKFDFTKKEKIIEFKVKLDYNTFKLTDNDKREYLILEGIKKTIDHIIKNLNKSNFDFNSFLKDLDDFIAFSNTN